MSELSKKERYAVVLWCSIGGILLAVAFSWLVLQLPAQISHFGALVTLQQDYVVVVGCLLFPFVAGWIYYDWLGDGGREKVLLASATVSFCLLMGMAILVGRFNVHPSAVYLAGICFLVYSLMLFQEMSWKYYLTLFLGAIPPAALS